jgi:hypothetical protein
MFLEQHGWEQAVRLTVYCPGYLALSFYPDRSWGAEQHTTLLLQARPGEERSMDFFPTFWRSLVWTDETLKREHSVVQPTSGYFWTTLDGHWDERTRVLRVQIPMRKLSSRLSLTDILIFDEQLESLGEVLARVGDGGMSPEARQLLRRSCELEEQALMTSLSKEIQEEKAKYPRADANVLSSYARETLEKLRSTAK